MAIESSYKLCLTTIPGMKELPFIVFEINVEADKEQSCWHLGLPGKPSKLISSGIYTTEVTTAQQQDADKLYEWLHRDLMRFVCEDIGLPLADQKYVSSQINYFYSALQSGQFDEALRRLAAQCINAKLRDHLLASGVVPA